MNNPSAQALDRLIAGNQRFISGQSDHARRDAECRRALREGQNPFAVVLGCSDSRVPPEIIFDQGLGDLFVVRSAGHVVDNAVLGSLEFAAEMFQTPLILVLGHTSCGAVEAAARADEPPGYIKYLAHAIRTEMDVAGVEPGDPTADDAARIHAKCVAERLTYRSIILSQRVINGDLKIEAAIYDLETGRVEILE